MIFDVSGATGVVILLVIIGVTALIALVTFIVYRRLHPKLKDDNEKPTEKEILDEEMSRILKPVDDEDVAKEISNYKDEDDK